MIPEKSHCLILLSIAIVNNRKPVRNVPMNIVNATEGVTRVMLALVVDVGYGRAIIVCAKECAITVFQNSKVVLTDCSVFYGKAEKYDKRKDRR